MLAGGRGDDVYTVAFPTDEVIEREGEGIDEVRVRTPYTMPPHVENLRVYSEALYGSNGEWISGDAASLVGNSLPNNMRGAAFTKANIYGLGGDDTLCACNRAGAYLDGGEGNDTLINNVGESRGGPGADTFIPGARGAHTSPEAAKTILDFDGASGDRIQIVHPQATDAATLFAQGLLTWDYENRRLIWTSERYQADRPLAWGLIHVIQLPGLDVAQFDPSWIVVVQSAPSP